jgi:predicted SnoaL-like aldol condensation-catalyzing enzyme
MKYSTKKYFAIFIIALMLSACSIQGRIVSSSESREEANKQAALEFYQALVGDIDYDKAEQYTAEYIQHDPNVCCDGFTALKEFLMTSPGFTNRQPRQIEFNNVMADGDLVYFQLRNEIEVGDGERGLVQHSFRFNGEGLIAEHWVTNTRISLSETINPHPLF